MLLEAIFDFMHQSHMVSFPVRSEVLTTVSKHIPYSLQLCIKDVPLLRHLSLTKNQMIISTLVSHQYVFPGAKIKLYDPRVLFTITLSSEYLYTSAKIGMVWTPSTIQTSTRETQFTHIGEDTSLK